jgi:hypothetical protein
LCFFKWLSGRSVRKHEIRRSDTYYDTMSQMQKSISRGNFEKAARLVRENLHRIPDWVKETCIEFGTFDIRSIPALEQGGTVLALVGDDAGLAQMRDMVASISELEPWIEIVEQHQYDRQLFKAIMSAVAAHPNCLQSEVKDLVGESDGRRVANLLSYLEKAGRIVRIRSGRTYKLLMPKSPGALTLPPKPIPKSHRTHRRPPTLREIDLSSLSYVPLPRAPLRWEEAQADRRRAAAPKAENYFEVHDADWQIATIEAIPPSERPDTAFRKMAPTYSGIVMIDDLGKADGLGQIEAAVLHYDQTGLLVTKKGLKHDIYRAGVHPLGYGLIAMSRDCIVHAYDAHLEPILVTDLNRAPEIRALRRRFEIPSDQLKNHVRCVALSQDATCYLFTAVDEAWCIDMGGKPLWGVKLPLKDGWTQVAPPSSQSAMSEDVCRALYLMELSFPLTPEDIKRRYRELAKQWHPDLNPEDSKAHEKMSELNAAAEALTGIEASSIPQYTGATFMREIDRREFTVEGITFTTNISMRISGSYACDWIYAASFAANSDAAYLAGYSGRVILVDEHGEGLRVYDIGSIPRRIVDTGDYLYLLTDTRLYVLRDEALYSVVDTYDSGDLVVAQTGFGLLEKKRLRWFSADGQYLGSVIATDPIRRAYWDGDAMVVETRRRRAIVQGAPAWWK